MIRRNLLGLLLLLSVAACLEPDGDRSVTPLAPQETPANSNWLSIYFTQPYASNANKYRGGPDAVLAKAIDDARVSIDAAIYDLNLWSLRDALLSAYRRGLTVRIVAESDNLDEPEIQALKNEGIQVLGDRREGLMHNKFFILDRQEVWTGSMNFTTTDGYLNDNNLVRLSSAKLAENFTVEFEEMFSQDLFGPDILAATPYPEIDMGDAKIVTLFSPDDGVAKKLEEQIKVAQSSVYFLAFSFTSDAISSALIEQVNNGLRVAGVLEEAQVESNIGSEYQRLLDEGIDVRLDSNSRNMHHKVIILDERIVVMGSYNFSGSAETRNDENILILTDPQAAALFLQEFRRIFDHAH